MHLVRQLRNGEAGAVLHIDGVDVGIGAERESDVERVAAVGAARRLVVERVIDAVDLLLDRLRHRGLDHFGVGAGIVGGQRHLRRHDIGKLRDRDRRNGDEAGQRDDDGNDDGEARPVDENIGKHCAGCSLCGFRSVFRHDSCRHHLTRLHFLNTVGDDKLAFLEPTFDFDILAVIGAGRDAPLLDLL